MTDPVELPYSEGPCKEAFEAGLREGRRQGLEAARRRLEEPLTLEEAGGKGISLASSESVDVLSLSTFVENILKRGGVMTVGDLLSRRRDGLLGIDGFGDKSLREVEAKLSRYGYELSS